MQKRSFLIELQIRNRHFYTKRNLGNTFQTLFAQKRGLAHRDFLYENKSLPHYLSFDLRRKVFSP